MKDALPWTRTDIVASMAYVVAWLCKPGGTAIVLLPKAIEPSVKVESST